MNFFKPEDFIEELDSSSLGGRFQAARAAHVANRILETRGIKVRGVAVQWIEVCREPISQDTAESLLREVLSKREKTMYSGDIRKAEEDWNARARKVLGIE